ncbi:choice-of-anchor A family protein [Streptomyces sp. NBC_00335]|uniref:choice-of-anchor A family protein n=1 Tax=unclassified Streptomyces TaxID=2593676 RepID=UPI00225B23A5|nr:MULTISPECIES: choice-of-anchor A family protein [unclassified Streptomyces]MCX5404494.1 choice-of-anchor A family protein [Streptomyces sp. NBC_00086]
MSARKWTLGPLGLALGAVLAAGAPAALAAPAAPGPGGQQPAPARQAAGALRAPLPGGLGPCLGARCPDPFPQIEVGTEPNGYDEGINIFVGADFLVRERAAEAEGKVVVLGNFDQNKNLAAAGGAYNLGVVGAGSLVPPPDFSDFLTTGGNVNIAVDQRLIVAPGVVRYAGTAPGAGTVESRGIDPLVHDPAAITPYAGLRDQLTAASRCYARVDGSPRPATGTAVNQDGTTVFTGDNTSPLQVFNVDFDLVSASNGAIGFRFDRIPATATVLVNVLGTSRTINTYAGSINDTGAGADPWNGYRTRLLWNFPDATTVQLVGTGQFQGSVLVGEQASTTTVTLPGTNGRFFTTGGLVHTSTGGGGQEFHAYPFNGDLPDCGNTVPVTGKVSVLKQDTGGLPLAGATYELWRETNGTPGAQFTSPGGDTKVTDCVTPANGICSGTVAPGTYYWRETQAPAGYELAANPVVELTLTAQNAAEGVSATMSNTKLPGSAEVVLRKSDADGGALLPGARFELWREANDRTGLQTTGTGPDEQLAGSCTTDAQGSCTVQLPVGERYYWRETQAPAGYDLPADPVTPFDLTAGHVTTGLVVSVTDERTGEPEYEGSIEVLKKDAKTKRPLRGAVFEVWKETNSTSGLQTRGINPDRKVTAGCATDRAGACSFPGLDEGWYYVVETAVPEGYVLPRNRVTGPLHLDGTTPDHRLVVTLENKRDDHGKGTKPPKPGRAA